MLDIPVRRLIDPILDRTAARAARWGIGANGVTIMGFLIGMGGAAAVAVEAYAVGLVLILLNRTADGLDGAIARRTGATDLGGFLDIAADLIFYSAVPFAFAVAHADRRLAAAFLIFSFVGTGGSFLAYAVIAAKRGRTADRSGKKSFVYSVGLMEGTETIIFFVLFCVFPEQFVELAWVFGSLCWLTTALRIAASAVEFRRPITGDKSHGRGKSPAP